MAIKEVIDELDGPEFERAVTEKFELISPGSRRCIRCADGCGQGGQIHTDSKDKIITVLLYLNENWPHAGGRLRLLRNGTDLENFVTEVPPDNGTLLVFKRGTIGGMVITRSRVNAGHCR